MLQIAPDADIETETDEKTDDALYCAACGALGMYAASAALGG